MILVMCTWHTSVNMVQISLQDVAKVIGVWEQGVERNIINTLSETLTIKPSAL